MKTYVLPTNVILETMGKKTQEVLTCLKIELTQLKMDYLGLWGVSLLMTYTQQDFLHYSKCASRLTDASSHAPQHLAIRRCCVPSPTAPHAPPLLELKQICLHCCFIFWGEFSQAGRESCAGPFQPDLIIEITVNVQNYRCGHLSPSTISQN